RRRPQGRRAEDREGCEGVIRMFGIRNLAALVLLTASLAACDDTPSPASEVARIQSLPEVPVDQAIKNFRDVCVRGRENRLGEAVIFSQTTVGNGQPVCVMRARLPEGLNAFAEMRNRFGNGEPVGNGLVTRFPGFPGKPLLLLQGASNGGGAGTYQMGVLQ
ncbi:hypothetical protein, partial [Roseovarius atlanticus]|uniref:hypothetical protein n=1 Tax=Roseovarius atlanticus TaxID=1641875 RepID=UPI001F2D72A6